MLCFHFALAVSTTLVTKKLDFAHPSQTELLLAYTDLLQLAVTSSSDFLYFLYSRAESCPALSLACVNAYCTAKCITSLISSAG